MRFHSLFSLPHHIHTGEEVYAGGERVHVGGGTCGSAGLSPPIDSDGERVVGEGGTNCLGIVREVPIFPLESEDSLNSNAVYF